MSDQEWADPSLIPLFKDRILLSHRKATVERIRALLG